MNIRDDLNCIENMASDMSIYPKSEIVAGYKIMPSGEYIGIIGLLHEDKIIGHFWGENDSYQTITAYISKKYLK